MKERELVSAPIERANDLRSNLVSLLALLNDKGGFSSTSTAGNRSGNWTEHDVQLASHLATTFHMLKNSGFRPPRANKRLQASDEERLVNFIDSCMMIFNTKSPMFLLANKVRNPARNLTPEEEESYLRDLTSLLYVLASGGDVFKLISSYKNLNDVQLTAQQQQLAVDYAILLSQADGPKLPFRGKFVL